MNLIKDGKVAATDWQFIEEGGQLSANSIVGVELLLNSNNEQMDALKFGVLIDGDEQLDDLIAYLTKIDLIVIAFSSFADGRGFSMAYRLRNSFGYEGEIWAKGNLIADQYSQAKQCGIDGVVIDDLHLKRQPIEQWQKALAVAPLPYPFGNQSEQVYHQPKNNRFT